MTVSLILFFRSNTYHSIPHNLRNFSKICLLEINITYYYVTFEQQSLSKILTITTNSSVSKRHIYTKTKIGCLCLSLSQSSSDQDRVFEATTVHAKISIFQANLQARLLTKPKVITQALEDIATNARKAGLTKIAKKWSTNQQNFEVVRRSSSSSTAVAFATFNFGGSHGLSPQKIMALNKNARSCSRAYERQDTSSNSDSSRPSNRRSRIHSNTNHSFTRRTADTSCFKCNRKGHFAMNCPQSNSQPQRPFPQTRTPCHICKKTGHNPNACWSNPQSKNFRPPSTKKEP